MDIDDDDGFYSPEESTSPGPPALSQPSPVALASPAAAAATARAATTTAATSISKKSPEELEEGEEEDEGGGEMDEDEESDIDIITERKDGRNSAPQPQLRYSEIRNIPQRSTANDATVKAPPTAKKDEPMADSTGASRNNSSAPASSAPKIDINAIPIHKGTGKPITQVNIDEDLADGAKPWRQPGTDLSDYFNYGFDEFTWALYAAKQESLRRDYCQDAVAEKNKKMMEDMTNMMMMGGIMPGAPSPPTGPTGGGGPAATAAVMPGLEGIPPEMQAMMQQMMAGGMDPSQMDPSTMAAMFSGMQGGGGRASGAAGQGAAQGFGAGFGGNQGQSYGYDQQGMGGSGGGGGGGNRGNFGGRGGRGGRRW